MTLTCDPSHDYYVIMKTGSTITPEAIKKFRQDNGLTQQQLAAILNVGIASISRWEAGKKSPTGTAAAILEALLSPSTAGAAKTINSLLGVSPSMLGAAGLMGAVVIPGFVGGLGSAYSIYRLLKRKFEGASDTESENK